MFSHYSHHRVLKQVLYSCNIYKKNPQLSVSYQHYLNMSPVVSPMLVLFLYQWLHTLSFYQSFYCQLVKHWADLWPLKSIMLIECQIANTSGCRYCCVILAYICKQNADQHLCDYHSVRNGRSKYFLEEVYSYLTINNILYIQFEQLSCVVFAVVRRTMTCIWADEESTTAE